MRRLESVVVIGLGYVGLPIALLSSRKGYQTVGLDSDSNKLHMIRQKVSPINDADIKIQLKNSKLKVSSDYSVCKNADIVIICVPTPVGNGFKPDLKPLKNACTSLAKHLKPGTLVILESTVNPGVSETIVIPLLNKSGLKAGRDFYVAHCPERINPGDVEWNVENIPRVIGSLEGHGLKAAQKFYKSIITGSITLMGSLKEAEAVKIVENSFRDINIAFVNELAMSFHKLGINIVNVIDGASTKPFAFMAHYPGCGVGGHCIPVDPYYLIEYAQKRGFQHDFLLLARGINNGMPRFTVDIAEEVLIKSGKKLKKSQIAVLGLSYKSNIDDDRESPSYEIIRELEQRGASVRSYDPHVLHKSSASSLSEAVKSSDILIVATGHKEFIELDPKMLSEQGVMGVIDGRNCLDSSRFQEAGLIYCGIGT